MIFPHTDKVSMGYELCYTTLARLGNAGLPGTTKPVILCDGILLLLSCSTL